MVKGVADHWAYAVHREKTKLAQQIQAAALTEGSPVPFARRKLFAELVRSQIERDEVTIDEAMLPVTPTFPAERQELAAKRVLEMLDMLQSPNWDQIQQATMIGVGEAKHGTLPTDRGKNAERTAAEKATRVPVVGRFLGTRGNASERAVGVIQPRHGSGITTPC